MSRVDLLMVTHNRLRFVEWSYAALLEHTNWDLVHTLHLIDDNSTDGTQRYEWLTPPPPPTVTITTHAPVGGPVNAMNRALDRAQTDILAKIDSDVIVCPGWLDQMLAVLDANPKLDCLGMEPGFGGDVAPLDAPRSYEPARWVGGVCLVRTKVFAKRRPVQNERFHGWTTFQKRYCRSGWITPALPVFLLDLLDLEPYRSLTETYIERGYQRPLHRKPGRYDSSFAPFWEWWIAEDPSRKMETAGA